MSERILVVDDDAPIRRTFDEHLSEAGYEVRTAADAEEALELLVEFDPALGKRPINPCFRRCRGEPFSWVRG